MVLPPPQNVNAQPHPTCPRCQRTFRAAIGLVGHLRANCSARSASTVVSSSTSLSPPTLSTSVDRPSEPPLSSSSSSAPSSSSSSSTSVAVASAMPINITYDPDTRTNANTTTVNTSDKNVIYTRPDCDRTFTSRFGLIGHLRIHRTETGEPVPAASTYTRHIHFHCPHCPRTFMHRMGLFSHMCIHEGGNDRSPDTPSTSLTPTLFGPTHTPLPSAPTATSFTISITEAGTDAADCSVHTVPVHLSQALTWSATCESIAQRLANQYLEQQLTLAASASTVHIAFAQSRTAAVYLAACASTKTCGRQPPAAPHH
ncbi:hypothetical protein SprV_0100285500 [Sparganum proliferum]